MTVAARPRSRRMGRDPLPPMASEMFIARARAICPPPIRGLARSDPIVSPEHPRPVGRGSPTIGRMHRGPSRTIIGRNRGGVHRDCRGNRPRAADGPPIIIDPRPGPGRHIPPTTSGHCRPSRPGRTIRPAAPTRSDRIRADRHGPDAGRRRAHRGRSYGIRPGFERSGRHVFARASSWPAARARGCTPSHVVSKQLLPVYDKPMIYYPLSTLMLAGIREILLISTPEDIAGFQRLLGDGAPVRHRHRLRRAAAARTAWPRRSSSGRRSSAEDRVALILGDNIFYGQGFQAMLRARRAGPTGATVFAYRSRTPSATASSSSTRGARALDRGEAGAAQVAPRRDRPVLLRQPGGRDRPRT